MESHMPEHFAQAKTFSPFPWDHLHLLHRQEGWGVAAGQVLQALLLLWPFQQGTKLYLSSAKEEGNNMYQCDFINL